MQLDTKMNFSFNFTNELRKKKQMQLLIVNYADRQMIRAGKLEKSSQR